MASGIADAMAKWYEASLSSGQSQDTLARQAVEQARLLRDQLLLECEDALAHPGGAVWGRVVEKLRPHGRAHRRPWRRPLSHRSGPRGS